MPRINDNDDAAAASSVVSTHARVMLLVSAALEEISADFGLRGIACDAESTPLYGVDGTLDSIALVHLVVALERQIQDEFGTILVLASDKALSSRNSPFRSVGSVATYITQLLGEA